MKIYSCPDECPAPKIDYMNYDYNKVATQEAEHRAALKKHLIESGYTGKHTGGIASFGVADGSAQYMLADGKGAYGPSFLIHMPYGDAYSYRGIEHFTKKAIIEEIELRNRRDAFFAKKRETA